MPRRGARSGKILEWVANRVTETNTATVATGTLDLDLLPDEIAEIWTIDSRLEFYTTASAGVDDEMAMYAYLSMDPSASADPSSATSIADLETFFHHRFHQGAILDGSATSFTVFPTCHHKTWQAINGKPILVGTNVGMVFSWVSAGAVYGDGLFEVRLYFTRRRATASELNQILLKRR